MSARNRVRVTLTVNGVRQELELAASTTLVEALRSDLRLTGTKVACDGGECGACTVLVDGEPMLSCLLLVAELDGREITTIEGATDERVARMRTAFANAGALQCGFCTPGLIIAASRVRPGADGEEIRHALAGNLCRCTGYSKIVEAVERALASEADDG